MKAQYLFELSTYKWSMSAVAYGGYTYTATVVPGSFDGINCRLDLGSSGLIAPNDLTFDIIKGVLTRSNIEDQSCTIRLIIDGVQSRVWKMTCVRAVEYYGKIKVYCKSILTTALDGTYPKTQHPKEIWPSDEVQDENLDSYTVPIVLGTAYIPVAPIISGSNAYYVIGDDTAPTYNISEITSPRDWGNKSIWDNSYTYTQSDLLDHKVFRPIIHDSDGDGTEDACGVWNRGGRLLYPLVKFSRSDTLSLTSPEEWLEYILEDMGVASVDIDATTFASAAAIYASRGVTFNGGLWEKEERESIIKSLLLQCDSFLYVSDKIELHPFDATSKETFTTADTKTNSFNASPRTIRQSDGGHVEWVNSGSPQDTFTGKAICKLYNAQASIVKASDEIMSCRFMTDSQTSQIAGILFFAKSYLVKDDVSFETSIANISTINTIIPGHTITINDTMFGASFVIIITDMSFQEDFSVNISGVRLEYTEDWDDISASVIPVAPYTETGWVDTPAAHSAMVFVYKRSASTPAGISTVTTYTFGSGVLTGADNGWTQAIPTVDGNPLYVQTAMIYSESVVAAIAVATWTAPVKMAEDGPPGTIGLGALTAILSNPAVSIAFDGDGIAISGAYDNSGTTIKLFEGDLELTYDGVGTSPGTWKVTATGTNITVGSLTDSGTYVTTGFASSITAATASIDFIITGQRVDGSAISINLIQTFSKVAYGSRSGGIFTFEESTDAYITATDMTFWDNASFTNTLAAQNVAQAVMAVSSDGYIRPNDRITVTDNSADLAATRIYTGAASNVYSAISFNDYSALVVETFSGSVIVDGTLSANKLAASTTLTNNLIVGSYMSISNTGAIFTSNKTTYSDPDSGIWLGYDSTAYKLNIGNATDYIKWTGNSLAIASNTVGGITVNSVGGITVSGTGGIVINDNGDLSLEGYGSAINFYNGKISSGPGYFLLQSTGELNIAAYYTGASPTGLTLRRDDAVLDKQLIQTTADAFQVKMSASQSNIAVGTNVTVQFNSETGDNTAAFNTATYTYTAKGISGWRQFNVTLKFDQIDTAASSIVIYLITSNENFGYIVNTSDVASGFTAQYSFSLLAWMDLSDTAFVCVYITGGAAQTDIKPEGSFFSGFYVNG